MWRYGCQVVPNVNLDFLTLIAILFLIVYNTIFLVNLLSLRSFAAVHHPVKTLNNAELRNVKGVCAQYAHGAFN